MRRTDTSISVLDVVHLAPEVRAAIEASPRVYLPNHRDELYRLSLGLQDDPVFTVAYEANGATVTEATVTRCRNGIAVNYPEDYIRRRDPRCMHIADDRPTDKTRYRDAFGSEFIATIVSDPLMPATNWIAPETPHVMISFGLTVRPESPICRFASSHFPQRKG